MSVSDAFTATLVLVGAGFGLLAAIGLARMPDLYMRMQSATKAGTLGVACAVLGVAVHFGDAATVVEAVLVILFLFATAPIASHLIARAAYGEGAPIWRGVGGGNPDSKERRRARPTDAASGDQAPAADRDSNS